MTSIQSYRFAPTQYTVALFVATFPSPMQLLPSAFPKTVPSTQPTPLTTVPLAYAACHLLPLPHSILALASPTPILATATPDDTALGFLQRTFHPTS